MKSLFFILSLIAAQAIMGKLELRDQSWIVVFNPLTENFNERMAENAEDL